METRPDSPSVSRDDVDQLLRSINATLIEVSPDGDIRMASESACTLLGYTEAELLGRSIDIIFSGAGASADDSQQHAARPVEHTGLSKDGRHIPVRLSRFVMHDDQGRIDRIVYLGLDMSERRSMESQLHRAQKLTLIGQLARSVAHDMNNILSVITGRSVFLLQSPDLKENHRNEIKEIREAANLATSVMQHLLDFSRPQVPDLLILDLNAGLTGLRSVLTRVTGEDIQLRLNCGPNLGYIQADQGQLEQVLLNVIINASDAMPDGGSLTIETANVELNEADARIYGTSPGPYVSLAVCDTGCGMDADTRSKIFEPFFSTKSPDKGTGLGLSTVYGIVKQLGGGIGVESAVGQGTTFTIYLPKIDPNNLPLARASETAQPISGIATILLVDESMILRNLVSDSLKKNGYTVLEAKDGPEAVAIGEQHTGSLDILVTDVVVPEMAAAEIVTRLQKRHGTMRVLYISAFDDTALRQHGITDPERQVIRKPFTEKELVSKVEAMLEGMRAE